MDQCGRAVHLSIDDIGKSLRWLSYNKPNSIFDMRLYGQLKQWHDTYNARFSLYCFAMLDDYLITEMPDTYADELGKSGDWLKFGFHGKNNSRFFDEEGYKAGYALFMKAAENAGMPVTDTIRLHNWLASDEQKTFLHTRGINTLLYPDDEKLPYFDKDEFMENGMEHWKTHIRFEHLDEVTQDTLFIGRSRIVAFTHEKYVETERDKIENALKIFCSHGYHFI